MLGLYTPGEVAPGELADAETVITVPSLSATASLGVNIKLNKIVYAPAAVTVTATLHAPILEVGFRLDVPSLKPTAVIIAPKIATGVRLQVPSLTAVATITPPISRSGLSIVVSNTVTMTTDYGEIGSGTPGEFSIGEGPQGTRAALSNLKAHVQLIAPKIATGVRLQVPSLTAIAHANKPQVHGRYRPVRIWTIAS